MKAGEVLLVVSMVVLTGSMARAQSATLPQVLQGAQQELDALRQRLFEGQQRAGGGRGAAPGDVPIAKRPLQRIYWNARPGAWWTNTALVTQLGLTDDQKAKIEKAFENHRQKLQSSTELLDKEEAQLALLLAAESIDRNAILTQIDRVIQARAEMERENAAMTLEMRESLTRAQWMQLPQPWPAYGATPVFAITPNRGAAEGAGGRGGARGGQRQQ
jgi:hypothetical protein